MQFGQYCAELICKCRRQLVAARPLPRLAGQSNHHMVEGRIFQPSKVLAKVDHDCYGQRYISGGSNDNWVGILSITQGRYMRQVMSYYVITIILSLS